jgi:hypothetical protein
MEYGSIFHKLIEEGTRLGNKYTRVKLTKTINEWVKDHYKSPESLLLAKIAIVQYHEYKKWEKTRPKYNYIAQEPVFDEEYTLPECNFKAQGIKLSIPKTKIRLRGRIDEVIEQGGKIWLQENKTKSRIDTQIIVDTVPENIQVMFYAVAARLKYGKPVAGFIYNIIRKPGQRQRKSESDNAYLDRIEEEIQADPEYYFKRLTYTFKPNDIKKWEREELQPLLYQLYIWWKSIEANPTEPWTDEEGNVNPFHGRRSFGIFDPMSVGKGEFFELIVYGKTDGLVIDNEMFPELKDD